MIPKYAIVLGYGAIKLSWNEMLGKQINEEEIEQAIEQNAQGMGEEVQVPGKEYEGDLEIGLVSPLDMITDLSKEDDNHDWQIVRSFKNRYDLIAQYPDIEEGIMGVDSKDSMNRISFAGMQADETDDIPVFEAYHKRTPALPNGRYTFYSNEDSIYYDGDLPYREIPIYSVCPSKILGTSLGYTSLFDVLPIQDAMNSLYSAVLSNQSAFAVQNVLVPQGCNVDVNQISGALNVLNYNAQAGKPEAMNLTSTPKEVFEYLNMLNGLAETLSGISSVVRGNPEASLRSGAAIAMIQSNAIQFMSGLQQSYITQIEGVGLGMLQILMDFANSPRIANIVGESGRSYMKEFKGDDLRDINRVIVDAANPLTKTISGRTQMADNLLQYQLLKDPNQYINIINTGKLEVGTEEVTKELNLIKGENEGMLLGEAQYAVMTDTHLKHINSHKSVLDDPMIRRNQELTQMVLDHIQAHIDLLKNSDPNTLMALGQQPIAPAAPPVPQQGNPQPGGEPVPAEAMQDPNMLPPEEQANAAVPDVRMPTGFEESPLSPDQGMAQVRGDVPPQE